MKRDTGPLTQWWRPLAGGSLTVTGFVFAWSLLWWLVRTVAQPNLDGYGDMLENYAWGQVFEWGTHKHPPLQAWAAGAWFSVWPTTAWAYWLLSGLNGLLALLGIAALARQDAVSDQPSGDSTQGGVGQHRVLVAVLLAALALPYTTLASKLNANSVLLSVWPWTVWFLLRSVYARPGGGRPLLNAVGLGLLAALAMLGKYYSGVLLLALALAALASGAGRRWYATRWPWMALAVFVLALSPHVAWLLHHQGLSLKYIADQGDGHVGLANTLKFALSPLLYWIIPVIIVAGLFWRLRPAEKAKSPSLLHRLWRGPDDILLLGSVLVWAITLVFGLSGFVELSLPWSIPIGFAYTVLVVRLLDGAQVAACVMGLRRYGGGAALVLLMLAVVSAAVHAVRPSGSFDLPRKAAAQAVMARWHQMHPNEPLAWVAGEWPEIALLAFYGDARVRVLPDEPDTPTALTVSRKGEFSGRWGAWLCTDTAAPSPCVVRAQALAQQTGQSLQTMTVHAQGWPWWTARSRRYSVVFIPPTALVSGGLIQPRQ